MIKRLILLLMLTIGILVNAQNERDDLPVNKGFFNITKLSFIVANEVKRDVFTPGEGGRLITLDAQGSNARSLNTVSGYFISPRISLGLGLGLDGYRNPDFNSLPLFLDIRLYNSKYEQNSLYSFLNVGPTIKLGSNSTFRKGAMLNIGIGYKYNLGGDTYFVTDVFYSHKTVSFTEEGIAKSDDVIITNGFGIGAGIAF